jgi:hypothetical protein
MQVDDETLKALEEIDDIDDIITDEEVDVQNELADVEPTPPPSRKKPTKPEAKQAPVESELPDPDLEEPVVKAAPVAKSMLVPPVVPPVAPEPNVPITECRQHVEDAPPAPKTRAKRTKLVADALPDAVENAESTIPEMTLRVGKLHIIAAAADLEIGGTITLLK